MLQRHYQLLSKMSVDGMSADWKEEIEGTAACQRK